VTWNIVPTEQQTTPPDWLKCQCGHDIHDHAEDDLGPCEVKGCGCDMWVDADPDDDWVAGEDDDAAVES